MARRRRRGRRGSFLRKVRRRTRTFSRVARRALKFFRRRKTTRRLKLRSSRGGRRL